MLGFCLGPALGGDAGGGQRGGLLRSRVVREAFDDFDKVVLGIEVLGAAVGEQGVDEGNVRPGFEAGRMNLVRLPMARTRSTSLSAHSSATATN